MNDCVPVKPFEFDLRYNGRRITGSKCYQFIERLRVPAMNGKRPLLRRDAFVRLLRLDREWPLIVMHAAIVVMLNSMNVLHNLLWQPCICRMFSGASTPFHFKKTLFSGAG